MLFLILWLQFHVLPDQVYLLRVMLVEYMKNCDVTSYELCLIILLAVWKSIMHHWSWRKLSCNLKGRIWCSLGEEFSTMSVCIQLKLVNHHILYRPSPGFTIISLDFSSSSTLRMQNSNLCISDTGNSSYILVLVMRFNSQVLWYDFNKKWCFRF